MKLSILALAVLSFCALPRPAAAQATPESMCAKHQADPAKFQKCVNVAKVMQARAGARPAVIAAPAAAQPPQAGQPASSPFPGPGSPRLERSPEERAKWAQERAAGHAAAAPSTGTVSAVAPAAETTPEARCARFAADPVKQQRCLERAKQRQERTPEEQAKWAAEQASPEARCARFAADPEKQQRCLERARLRQERAPEKGGKGEGAAASEEVQTGPAGGPKAGTIIYGAPMSLRCGEVTGFGDVGNPAVVGGKKAACVLYTGSPLVVDAGVSVRNGAFTSAQGFMFPKGKAIYTFPVATTAVESLQHETITIVFIQNGLHTSAGLDILPGEQSAGGLASIKVSPDTVPSGDPISVTVTMAKADKKKDRIVTLSSNHASVTVPQSITIPANQTSASIQVNTSMISDIPVGNDPEARITATWKNESFWSAFHLTSPSQRLDTISLTQTSVEGGKEVSGHITLTKAGGPLTVALTFIPNTCPISVPPVSVAGGQSSSDFTVKTTPGSGTCQIRATLNGIVRTANLTVTPAVPVDELASVGVNPVQPTGGEALTVTVKLRAKAQVDQSVALSVTPDNQVVTVQPTVIIPAGMDSAAVAATSRQVAATQNITLKATMRGVSVTSSFDVTAVKIGLSSISLTPNKVEGGQTVRGEVRLTGSSPIDVSVGLVLPPGVSASAQSITIPANSISAQFTLTTPVVTEIRRTFIGAKNSWWHEVDADLEIDPVANAAAQKSGATGK